MPPSRDPRCLRALAEQVVDLAHFGDTPEIEREDIVTSLTRQWLTYDGHATFVSADGQTFIDLTGEGRSLADVAFSEVDAGAWFQQCMRDWEFGEDEFGEALNDLNFAQSAVVENRQGVALRLWVDPRERTKGIEPLEPGKPPPPARVKFRKLAQDAVDMLFGEARPAPERADLATSLARQWVTGDGRGMILAPDKLHRIRLIPDPGRGHLVETSEGPLAMGRDLMAAGVPAADVIEIVRRLNLGQTPEVADRSGRRYRLVADPVNGRVDVEPLDAPPSPGPLWFQIVG